MQSENHELHSAIFKHISKKTNPLATCDNKEEIAEQIILIMLISKQAYKTILNLIFQEYEKVILTSYSKRTDITIDDVKKDALQDMLTIISALSTAHLKSDELLEILNTKSSKTQQVA